MWAAGGWKRDQARPSPSPVFGREPAEATLSPTAGGFQRVASSLTL